MECETRESITLKKGDQKIFGMLHLPKNQNKSPAVLFFHGLGGDKCGAHRIYVLIAESLSKLGIASFRFDFCGAGDSEGDFVETTIESQVEDALIAMEYLKKHPRIKSEHIGFFGRSFGGVIAIIAAARTDAASSLVLWAPFFDGEQWKNRLENVLAAKGVSEDEMLELSTINGLTPGIGLFQQIAHLETTKLLEQLHHIPLLHIYGEKDEVIDLLHAHKYEYVRKDAVAESKFIRYPESDHDFLHQYEQKQAIDETVNWFQETLVQ